jgi:hypothetical protein
MKISTSTVALFLVAYSRNTHAIKTLQGQRNSLDVESFIIQNVITEAEFSGEEQALWQRLLVDTVASMPLTGKIITTMVQQENIV